MINIILAGVGGQGIVLASKMITQTALDKGMQVRSSETIGMAQRGGCVASHIRIGEKIFSPLIPRGAADIIIGFEPAEAVRYLPYLKEAGTVIVSQKAIKPALDPHAPMKYDGQEMLVFLSGHVKDLITVDAQAIYDACGSAKILNTALLGVAAAAGVLGFTVLDLEKTITNNLPKKLLDINLKALHIGAKTIISEENQK